MEKTLPLVRRTGFSGKPWSVPYYLTRTLPVQISIVRRAVSGYNFGYPALSSKRHTHMVVAEPLGFFFLWEGSCSW